MPADDPLDMLARMLDDATSAIGHVDDDQDELPTPCRSWTVRSLVNHLVDDLDQFAIAAQGGRPDWDHAVPDVTGDRAAAFREGSQRLLAGWRQSGDLDRTIELPIGTVPARFILNQQLAEFAVHTWDLLAATGRHAELDPGIAETALAWARTALAPEYRGTEEDGFAFGPEVPVAEDAPAYARLAGMFGRQP